mmetsp:Transcript_78011/g.137598  ORF Transcript_78011/g.137598 Transcript_78011/m.137598 type:complete len:190 (-) Transcript_78011:1197-1766(-)
MHMGSPQMLQWISPTSPVRAPASGAPAGNRPQSWAWACMVLLPLFLLSSSHPGTPPPYFFSLWLLTREFTCTYWSPLILGVTSSITLFVITAKYQCTIFMDHLAIRFSTGPASQRGHIPFTLDLINAVLTDVDQCVAPWRLVPAPIFPRDTETSQARLPVPSLPRPTPIHRFGLGQGQSVALQAASGTI